MMFLRGGIHKSIAPVATCMIMRASRDVVRLPRFMSAFASQPPLAASRSAIAAIKANRSYVGHEIDAEYVRLAERRISEL